MNLFERVRQNLGHRLLAVIFTDSLFKVHLESELNECRCVSSVRSMAIAYSKQVEGRPILDVWRQYKAVLVNFVWVVRLIPDSCGKCKLLHHILGLQLLLRTWNVSVL